MSDNRATQGGTEVQLGARARSILKSLSESGPARLAAARLPVKREPATEPSDADAPEQGQRRGLAAARRADAAANGERSEQTNTVVPLPRRDTPRKRGPGKPDIAVATPVARPAVKQRQKRNFVALSAWFAIGLPTAAAIIYYGFIAAPQYVAEARFAVRGADESTSSSGDLMSALNGLGGGASSTGADSYIVSQYIESAQLVGTLQKVLDLRAAYTNPKADFMAKYRPYDFNDTIEHLTTYWNQIALVNYEPLSGVVTFTVRAFTPDDALKIARETVRQSELLVNRLSERAREDAISNSKQEQARAEMRLSFARKAIQDYRDRKGSTDPTTLATSQTKIVDDLEGQLAKLEADLAATLSFLSKDAPTVKYAQKNVEALQARIAIERAKIGTLDQQKGVGGTAPISASMAEFERLATERDFAQTQYVAATSAVEAARIRAERQSRYITTFVEPHLPEDSLYPARLQMMIMVLVCAALAWAIGLLIFYGIRDHAA